MLKTELEIVTVGTPDIAMLSENEQDILIRCGFTLSRTLETQAAHLFVRIKYPRTNKVLSS